MKNVDIVKLVELAGDEAEKLQEELYRLTKLIALNFQLANFIEDIGKPAEAREKMIIDAFPSSSRTFKGMINVLIKNELCRKIPEVSAEVSEIVAKKLGVRFDELVFSEKPAEELLLKFNKIANGKVKFRIEIDPSIMGGFIWKTADGRIMDASIAGRLSAIKEEIAA